MSKREEKLWVIWGVLWRCLSAPFSAVRSFWKTHRVLLFLGCRARWASTCSRGQPLMWGTASYEGHDGLLLYTSKSRALSRMTPLKPGHDLAFLSLEDSRVFITRWFQHWHLWPSLSFLSISTTMPLPMSSTPAGPSPSPAPWIFSMLPASVLSLVVRPQPGLHCPTPQSIHRAFPSQFQADFTKKSFLLYSNYQKEEFLIKIFIHTIHHHYQEQPPDPSPGVVIGLVNI